MDWYSDNSSDINGNVTDEIEPVPRIVYVVSNIGLVLCTGLVIILIRTFARPDTRIAYLIQVFMSWWFGFAGTLVLLPLDLSASIAQSPCKDIFEGAEKPPCDGNFKSNDHFFIILWKIVYWVTFVFSWIICPIVMDYSIAGEFKPKEKLVAAILGKIKFYVVVGVLGLVLVLFIMLTAEFTIDQMLGYVIALSNIYGTGLIVVMMGYGMIEFPRSVWRASDPKRMLDDLFYQAPSVEGTLLDMRERIDILRERLLEFQRRVPPDDIELANHAQHALEKLPLANTLDGHSASGARRLHESEIQEIHSDIPEVRNITYNALVRFHYVVKDTIMEYDRMCYEWENIISETRKLAIIVNYRENKYGKGSAVVGIGESENGTHTRSVASASYDRTRESSASMSFGRSASMNSLTDINGQPTHQMSAHHSSAIETTPVETDVNVIVDDVTIVGKPFVLWWRLKGAPIILRIFGIFSWINTIILLWNECMIPFDITYSVYGGLLHLAATDRSYIWIQLISFIFLSYMCMSCYTALFKFKLLDFLRLYPNGQSNVYAMLGNSAYLGRLQFALGFNFFSMIYDSESDVTAFHYLVGDLADAGPLLGSSFNKYVPAVMAVFAVSTFFNIVDRVLGLIGFNMHQHPRKGNHDHEETIEQGKKLVDNEKKRRQRHLERLERQRMQDVKKDDIIGSGVDRSITPPMLQRPSVLGLADKAKDPNISSRGITSGTGAAAKGDYDQSKGLQSRTQSISPSLGAPGSGLSSVLGTKSAASANPLQGTNPNPSQKSNRYASESNLGGESTRSLSPPLESNNSGKSLAKPSMFQFPSSFRPTSSTAGGTGASGSTEMTSIGESLQPARSNSFGSTSLSGKQFGASSSSTNTAYQQPSGPGMRGSSSFSSLDAIRNDMTTPPPGELTKEEQAARDSLFGSGSKGSKKNITASPSGDQSNDNASSLSSSFKRTFTSSNLLGSFQGLTGSQSAAAASTTPASSSSSAAAASSTSSRGFSAQPTNTFSSTAFQSSSNFRKPSENISSNSASQSMFGSKPLNFGDASQRLSQPDTRSTNNATETTAPPPQSTSTPGKRNLF